MVLIIIIKFENILKHVRCTLNTPNHTSVLRVWNHLSSLQIFQDSEGQRVRREQTQNIEVLGCLLHNTALLLLHGVDACVLWHRKLSNNSHFLLTCSFWLCAGRNSLLKCNFRVIQQEWGDAAPSVQVFEKSFRGNSLQMDRNGHWHFFLVIISYHSKTSRGDQNSIRFHRCDQVLRCKDGQVQVYLEEEIGRDRL